MRAFDTVIAKVKYGYPCEYCEGIVEEKILDESFWVKGKLIIAKNVPVGVCNKCKNKYYSADVLKRVEVIAGGSSKLKKIEVPVGDFEKI